MKTEVDERTQFTQLQIESLSYKVTEGGLAAILLYRVFILKQPLSTNWDIFLLGLLAGYLGLFLRCAKGLPPIKNERLSNSTIFSLILAVIIYEAFAIPIFLSWKNRDISNISDVTTMLLNILMLAFPVIVGLFALLLLWLEKKIYCHWEQRNLEGSETEE